MLAFTLKVVHRVGMYFKCILFHTHPYFFVKITSLMEFLLHSYCLLGNFHLLMSNLSLKYFKTLVVALFPENLQWRCQQGNLFARDFPGWQLLMSFWGFQKKISIFTKFNIWCSTAWLQRVECNRFKCHTLFVKFHPRLPLQRNLKAHQSMKICAKKQKKSVSMSLEYLKGNVLEVKRKWNMTSML